MNFIKNWWVLRKRKKQLAKAPRDLGEAIMELNNGMTDEGRAGFAKEPADHPGSSCHFFGGMAMRNNWGLWDREQPITKWFRLWGIWHADDMSAIIYKSYWCFLNDVPFDMRKEVEHYKKFWEESGCGFDGEELPNHTPTKVKIIRLKKPLLNG